MHYEDVNILAERWPSTVAFLVLVKDLKFTSNPCRVGAAWDVLVIVFNEDAVVSRQDRQIGHSAGPILVVHTADVCFGRTLNGQRQTTYKNKQS